jgi:hypothetical protein
MELKGNSHDIQMFENIVKNWVKHGTAYIVKKPFNPDGTAFVPNDQEQPRFSTSVYNIEKYYQLIIAPSPYTYGGRVNVRFWYDKRCDTGGVKITREGMMMIFSSMTVLGLLQKIGTNLDNGTNLINMDVIKNILIKAVEQSGNKIDAAKLELKDEKINNAGH